MVQRDIHDLSSFVLLSSNARTQRSQKRGFLKKRGFLLRFAWLRGRNVCSFDDAFASTCVHLRFASVVFQS